MKCDNYVEKIKQLKKRYGMTDKKISIAIDVNSARFKEIEDGVEMTKFEKKNIDTVLAIRKAISRPMETQEIIDEQQNIVNRLAEKATSKVGYDEVCDLILESMYLGVMMSSNSMEGIIVSKVKARRK